MSYAKHKVAIVGCGVSGMSAALEFDDNYDVTIYEATDRIGGRATTVYDKKLDEILDNGQHICIGAYKSFLGFLKKIGSDDKFVISDKYNIPYYYDGNIHSLSSKYFKGKFGLLEAILTDRNLSVKEKINAVVFAIKLQMNSIPLDRYKDCKAMLLAQKQSEKIIEILWEPLIVSTMNTPVWQADPKVFVTIMLDGFLSKSENATFYLPTTHFGELFSNFEKVFTSNEGCKRELKLSTPVKRALRLDEGFEINGEQFDSVIVTTPSFITKRLLEDLRYEVDMPKYSPIVSIYFWIDEKLIDSEMISLPQTKFDWLFNRSKLMSLDEGDYSYQITTSAADEISSLKDTEIMHLVSSELSKVFWKDIRIEKFKIIREKMATFLADRDNCNKRPNVKTHIKGLYIAGDYPQNNYPSTLEGAAINGIKAAHYILQQSLK
jgi:squalene-associated FAD-dependent desaturase